jgi:hypothetical protein
MIIKPPPVTIDSAITPNYIVGGLTVSQAVCNTFLFMKCSGLVASMREPLLVFTNMCDLTSYFKYKKFFLYWKTGKYAYLSYNTDCHHFYIKQTTCAELQTVAPVMELVK